MPSSADQALVEEMLGAAGAAGWRACRHAGDCGRLWSLAYTVACLAADDGVTHHMVRTRDAVTALLALHPAAHPAGAHVFTSTHDLIRRLTLPHQQAADRRRRREAGLAAGLEAIAEEPGAERDQARRLGRLAMRWEYAAGTRVDRYDPPAVTGPPQTVLTALAHPATHLLVAFGVAELDLRVPLARATLPASLAARVAEIEQAGCATLTRPVDLAVVHELYVGTGGTLTDAVATAEHLQAAGR
jgi:hypothetical protein